MMKVIKNIFGLAVKEEKYDFRQERQCMFYTDMKLREFPWKSELHSRQTEGRENPKRVRHDPRKIWNAG